MRLRTANNRRKRRLLGRDRWRSSGFIRYFKGGYIIIDEWSTISAEQVERIMAAIRRPSLTKVTDSHAPHGSH